MIRKHTLIIPLPVVHVASAGGLCAALGLTVLVGWYTHNLRLLTVYPGFVAMAYNTALAFFLGGAALLAAALGRSRMTQVGAVCVTIIGLLTLSEYVFGLNLGIDELLKREYIRAGIVNPTRMAVCTALCFSLTGAALLLSSWLARRSSKRHCWPLGVCGILGSLIAGLGIVALSGYFTGITAAYAWGQLTRMAVHTAVGFITLGSGIIALAWPQESLACLPDHGGQSRRNAPAIAPVWLPGIVAVGVATATVCLWQALIVQQSAQLALIHRLEAATPGIQTGSLARTQSLIPLGCLVGGLVLASLLASAVSLAQTARRRTAQIGVINGQLQAQIAERRRAEEEVLKREKRLKLITDSAPALIAYVDQDQRYRFVNKGYLRLFNMVYDQIVGKSMQEFLGSEPYGGIRAYVEAALSGQVVTYERAMPYRGVGERYIHCSYSPDFGPQGEVRGFVIMVTDITARKEAEAALRESQELLQLAMNAGGMATFNVDFATGWTTCSDNHSTLLGLPPDSRLTSQQEFLDVVHPDDRGALEQELALALQEHTNFATEFRVPWPDGSIHWLAGKGRFSYDESGRPIRMSGASVDITARKTAEEALHRAKDELERRVQERTADLAMVNEDLLREVAERQKAQENLIKEQSGLRAQRAFLRQVIDTDPNFIFVKDADGRFLLVNAAISEAYGTDPKKLVGCCEADFNPNSAEVEQSRRIERGFLASDHNQIVLEETMTDARGCPRHLHTVKRRLPSPDGSPARLLGISMDITARKELEVERERLLADALERADHDPLTGLANHRAFHKRLGEEADRAQREGTTLAVAVLDLDNFKFFNDCYGHPVGDEVLRKAAAALLGGNRSYDTLARFGGDEFALLLPGVTSEEAAQLPARLAARLADVGYAPPGYNTVIPISAAVGVAVFPEEVPTRGEALTLADERLRRAKTGGALETEADQVRASARDAVAGFSMLDALVAAVDNKDRYTRKHSEDVLSYSLMIAQGLGLGEQTQHAISVAALLHDVGKIGVPDAVLRKPGKLTDEEFAAIQQHPMMGAVIVGAVPGLEETLDAVRHHHERWDGGGYPFGLRGEETPLMARLLAVADAFSAMTTDRPYRKGMEAARALRILEEGAGTQWDPACVAAFLRTRGRAVESPRGSRQ